jgi:hypothetical protein
VRDTIATGHFTSVRASAQDMLRKRTRPTDHADSPLPTKRLCFGEGITRQSHQKVTSDVEWYDNLEEEKSQAKVESVNHELTDWMKKYMRHVKLMDN